MSRVRRSSPWVLPYLGLVTVFFLAQQIGRGAWVFTHVFTPERIAPFASLAKLGPQALGSYYAWRSAQGYELGSAPRRAWTRMSLWLVCWFLGQCVLSGYYSVLHATPPFPTPGDIMFTVGYAFVLPALFGFVSMYRSSGFAVASGREVTVIAVVACAVFGVVGWVVLVPVARSDASLGARVVGVEYPLLDLVAFIPAVVLLRITSAFRGGRVWTVWAALLAGIFFAMGGDVIFADVSPEHVEAVGPLADLLYVLGYSFCGYGIRLQYELVAD